jgi:hypothetical protein
MAALVAAIAIMEPRRLSKAPVWKCSADNRDHRDKPDTPGEDAVCGASSRVDIHMPD